MRSARECAEVCARREHVHSNRSCTRTNREYLLPPGEGVAKRRMRDPTLCVSPSPGLRPPSPGGRGRISKDASIFPSHSRDHAGAVSELFPLDAHLLQDRQVQIRDRRAFRQREVLSAEFQLTVASSNKDVWLRVVVMQITVAHV